MILVSDIKTVNIIAVFVNILKQEPCFSEWISLKLLDSSLSLSIYIYIYKERERERERERELNRQREQVSKMFSISNFRESDSLIWKAKMFMIF